MPTRYQKRAKLRPFNVLRTLSPPAEWNKCFGRFLLAETAPLLDANTLSHITDSESLQNFRLIQKLLINYIQSLINKSHYLCLFTLSLFLGVYIILVIVILFGFLYI